MEEQIIKTVTKSGNGAVVYVPSKWISRKVNITLFDLDIVEELFYLLKENLRHVIGLYVYGSYARGEQLEDSDIDILVVVDKRFDLKPNKFDIHMVDINALKDGVRKNPLIFLSIIKEAKAIINQYLLEEFKKIVAKDFSWFIKTAKSALKISKGLLDLNKKEGGYASNASIYSIILRARGFYLIKCHEENKTYTNKGFLNYLVWLGFDRLFIEDVYKVYRYEKMNKIIILDLPIDKTYNLCLRLEKEIMLYEKRKKS